jgi:hypothetical protein
VQYVWYVLIVVHVAITLLGFICYSVRGEGQKMTHFCVRGYYCDIFLPRALLSLWISCLSFLQFCRAHGVQCAGSQCSNIYMLTATCISSNSGNERGPGRLSQYTDEATSRTNGVQFPEGVVMGFSLFAPPPVKTGSRAHPTSCPIVCPGFLPRE